MLEWIYKKWLQLLYYRRKKRELSVQNFKFLSSEIRDIAELSKKLWLDDSKFQERIKRVQKEMDQLDQLLNNKSFSRLSKEKKEELRKSLLTSREELMKCIQSAPCPTDRIQ